VVTKAEFLQCAARKEGIMAETCTVRVYASSLIASPLSVANVDELCKKTDNNQLLKCDTASTSCSDLSAFYKMHPGMPKPNFLADLKVSTSYFFEFEDDTEGSQTPQAHGPLPSVRLTPKSTVHMNTPVSTISKHETAKYAEVPAVTPRLQYVAVPTSRSPHQRCSATPTSGTRQRLPSVNSGGKTPMPVKETRKKPSPESIHPFSLSTSFQKQFNVGAASRKRAQSMDSCDSGKGSLIGRYIMFPMKGAAYTSDCSDEGSCVSGLTTADLPPLMRVQPINPHLLACDTAHNAFQHQYHPICVKAAPQKGLLGALRSLCVIVANSLRTRRVAPVHTVVGM
jgi:hypothetical protein